MTIDLMAFAFFTIILCVYWYFSLCILSFDSRHDKMIEDFIVENATIEEESLL